MKYLITGITGFAGPHLANLLIENGHQVYGLVRSSNGRENDIRDIIPDGNFSKIKFVYGDLGDRRSLEKIFKENKFDGVFHLAAQSHPPTSFKDPEGTMQINATGSKYLLGAMMDTQPDCRFMMCSTSEVYGNVPAKAGKIDESFPIAPVNPYGVSKASADLYTRERALTLQKPYFVTRAFSHTGPRRGHMFSISSDAIQISRIMMGLQEPIIRVGNLDSRRAVMDVRDCVNAYYKLMISAKPGESYNVGADNLYSMGEILDMMLDLRGLKGKVEKRIDEKLWRPIDIHVQKPDSSKTKKLTGWKTSIPLKQTLSDLLDYWDKKIGSEKIPSSLALKVTKKISAKKNIEGRKKK